jgi:membrane-associated phospholipid phosphatase
MRSVATAAAAAFAALGGLVASGAASGLDRWAANHAMPLAGSPGSPPTFLESLLPLYHAGWHPAGAAVTQLVTLPGQVLVSFALVLAAALALRAGGRTEAGLAWLGAWAAGTAIEVVIRHVLTRPAIYRHGIHVTGFDASWPSGHALRCAIVACAFGAAWPRLRAPLAVWVVACAVLLELAAFHTPTDVLGGLLLAVVVGCGAVALERSGKLRLGLLRGAALRRARAGRG